MRMSIDPKDENWQKFRLAITVQDMAMLKLEMNRVEDAVLHLIESGDILR